MEVEKRNGELVAFDGEKIAKAAANALKCQASDNVARRVLDHVTAHLPPDTIMHVNDIHKLVENSLMEFGEYDAAREYIEYRSAHEPDIFRERQELRPAEYPQLLAYKDAIREAYWTHKEYDYRADVQSFHTNLTPAEQVAVKRSLLAISQTEIGVKKFWGNIDRWLPKPEISEVGATFSENEVRHADAYRFMINLLGCNEEYASLKDNDAIQSRLEYLKTVNLSPQTRQDFIKRLIFYTMTVENMSLFSQFYIIQTLNAEKYAVNGTANAVEATAVEENQHSGFGFDIISIIKSEHPDLWTDRLVGEIEDLIRQSAYAEHDIVDWMFEVGDSDVITAAHVKQYVNERANIALTNMGLEPLFDIPQADRDQFSWFEVKTHTTGNIDFFDKRDTAYSKNASPVTASDIFG